MPLVGLVNEKRTLSIHLSKRDIREIRGIYRNTPEAVVTACCHQPAYLRTSKTGLLHFVHRQRDACAYGGESAHHLRLKALVLRAALDAGWEADVEVRGDGWIADVLATKGRAKIAFEIQWSKQTLAITRERQERMASSNVRAAWFFRKAPHSEESKYASFGHQLVDHSLPIFELVGDGTEDKWDTPKLRIGNRTVLLESAVSALLSGRVRYRAQHAYTRHYFLRLRGYETSCYRTRCNSPFIAVDTSFMRQPDHEVPNIDNWYDDSSSLWGNEPWQERAIQHALRQINWKGLPLTSWKKRYSRTTGTQYWSNGCPRCDALFGDWFLHELVCEIEACRDESEPRLEAFFTVETHGELRDYPHWCFPEEGAKHCVESLPMQRPIQYIVTPYVKPR